MAVRTKPTLSAFTVLGFVLATMSPVALAAASAPSRAFRAGGRYVALGDSFTAGPLIWPRRGRPTGCDRSGRNYPALVAARSAFTEFADVSCSGARIRHMTQPQRVDGGSNPPQLDAVTADTTLVTFGIGGNDVGFGTLAIDCALISVTDLAGAPCQKLAGESTQRAVAEAEPRIAALLAEVRRRAPKARVLVVGYLRLMPARGKCWPLVPYAAGDVRFFDRIEQALNEVLHRQAEAAGAEFVDTYRDGIGHDMCAPPRRKWVEGILLTAPAAPIHPNAAGMRAVADRVLQTIATPAGIAVGASRE